MYRIPDDRRERVNVCFIFFNCTQKVMLDIQVLRFSYSISIFIIFKIQWHPNVKEQT